MPGFEGALSAGVGSELAGSAASLLNQGAPAPAAADGPGLRCVDDVVGHGVHGEAEALPQVQGAPESVTETPMGAVPIEAVPADEGDDASLLECREDPEAEGGAGDVVASCEPTLAIGAFTAVEDDALDHGVRHSVLAWGEVHASENAFSSFK